MSVFGTPTTYSGSTGSSITIDTAENDLIVVAVRSYEGTPTSVTDTIGNTYVAGDNESVIENDLQMFYCLNSKSANSSNEVSANSAANGWIYIWDVPVESGQSATFDTQGTNGADSGVPPISLSEDFSTQGSDEICFAALDIFQGPTSGTNVSFVTSGWTLDSAGITSTSENQGGAGHITFSTPQTDINVEMTCAGGGGQGGAITMLAFYGALPETYSVSGNAGVAGATVSWSGTSSGSTTADGSGNYSITGLANGSYTITPSLTNYTFSPISQDETVDGADITGVDFTATSTLTYSVPDCRNFGNFPNDSITVNGTVTYTVPSVDSRAAGAPVDSRAAGAPEACGTYPQNCRTQPPFED